MIHWELCKRLKFDNITKRYIHKSESVVENETQKILWDFDLHTNLLITARRLDQVFINKKRELVVEWVLLVADLIVKIKESENINEYMDFVWK